MENNSHADQSLVNVEKPKRGRKAKVQEPVLEVAQPKAAEVIEDSGSILAEMPKKKRIPNEKTLNALKAGRERLSQKWDEQRKEREAYAEKIAIKKANQIIRAKQNIKKQMGADDLSSDDEQPIVQIQPVKPKKKQVVYLPPESDSEEEVIYKKAPKQKQSLAKHDPVPAPVSQMPKIVFC